jgi:hypothetical protein
VAEQHGYELAPASEAARVAPGLVLDDRAPNSARENNCNIWLKMLDTLITAAVVLLRKA